MDWRSVVTPDERKAKQREYDRKRRAREKAGIPPKQRGRPKGEEAPHGSITRYNKGKCRCDLCRECANAARRRSSGANKPKTRQLISRAAPLTVRSFLPPRKEAARTYTETPVFDCGAPLDGGGYCRRLAPCSFHDV